MDSVTTIIDYLQTGDVICAEVKLWNDNITTSLLDSAQLFKMHSLDDKEMFLCKVKQLINHTGLEVSAIIWKQSGWIEIYQGNDTFDVKSFKIPSNNHLIL